MADTSLRIVAPSRFGRYRLARDNSDCRWAYTKRPELTRTACELPDKANQLGTICGFKNPEDLQHAPSVNSVFITEEGFGGRLLMLKLDALEAGPQVLWPSSEIKISNGTSSNPSNNLRDADCPYPADPSKLWPHGLSALESTEQGVPIRIAFVSHRLVNDVVTDSIQLFDLAVGPRPSLSWRGCLNLPDDVIGNDLVLLRDGSLLATNFAPRGTFAELNRSARRGGLGLETGDILRWSKETGWSHIPGTAAALPNGIAVSTDERMLYYADAGNSQVVVRDLRGADEPQARIKVSGAPNNLTVTASGKILATGETSSGDLPIICSVGGRQCRTGWEVWEIDPATEEVREVLRDDGKILAGATTALNVDDMLLIGSMADDRLGVYRHR